jgi:hypothetical protein
MAAALRDVARYAAGAEETIDSSGVVGSNAAQLADYDATRGENGMLVPGWESRSFIISS